MSSNEHPDMSGNWADAPFLCHHCGEPFPEEKAYGVASDDELLFCSADCVESWEDAQIEAMHPPYGDDWLHQERKTVMYVPTKGVLQELMSERDRQIAKGFDYRHDDQHADGSILTAAWLIVGHVQNDRGDSEQTWPRELHVHVKEKYQKDYRRRLMIAAAMLVAEIERMDRADKATAN